MEADEAQYANWVPKSYIYAFIIVEAVLLIISFLPIFLVVRILLWIAAGVVMFFGVIMLNAYYQFGKDQYKLQHEVHHVLINKLGWDGQGKALDIGTGSGGVAIKVAKKYPDTTIVGVDYWGKGWDYSQLMCEKNAKAEGVHDRTIFQKGSAANLPFENETFDAVVSNFVFHEVRDFKDKAKLIIEAMRVLKKGGLFSFQDPFLSGAFYGNLERFMQKLQECGISEIHFMRLRDSMHIPRLLQFSLFLGKMGTLYGKK